MILKQFKIKNGVSIWHYQNFLGGIFDENSCTKMIIGCLDGNPSNEYYKHIGGKFVKIRTFKLPNQELPENVYYYDSI